MEPSHRSEQALRVAQRQHPQSRILYETVFILALTLVAQFLGRGVRMVFFFVPTLYFFVEHFLRRRTWAETGFSIKAFPRELAANLVLILLVSVVIQFLVVWASKTWMPAFLDHVVARVPLTLGQTASYLPVLLVGTLWEEVNYRAFFQQRLSWFIPVPVAIGIVSLVFGIGHWAHGNPVIVTIDILLVILDSVFYGIIFARSKNVLVSWIAHFLANAFAIGFFLLL